MELGPNGVALGKGHRENLALAKHSQACRSFRLRLSAILIRFAVGAAVTAPIAITIVATRAMH